MTTMQAFRRVEIAHEAHARYVASCPACDVEREDENIRLDHEAEQAESDKWNDYYAGLR
jgi:hypothetical protein